MDKSTPLLPTRLNVSFIVPAYNAEKSIRRTVLSILGQVELTPFEVIVVDNNSSDLTVEQVRDLPIVLLQEKTPGAAITRQRGLSVAKGEFIAFVDADVTLAENWAFEAMKFFQKYPGVSVVQGKNVPVSDSMQSLMQSYRSKTISHKTFGSFNHLNTAIAALPQINTAAVMIRKRSPSWARCAFRPEYLRCEDSDLSLQLFFSGAHFASVPNMHSTVYDHRSPWAYAKRSYHTGVYAQRLTREWGLGRFHNNFEHKEENLDLILVNLLNAIAYRLGTIIGNFPTPLKFDLIRRYYRPAIENSLFLKIKFTDFNACLSPQVRSVILEDRVILFSLRKGVRKILETSNRERFLKAFEGNHTEYAELWEELLEENFLTPCE